MEKNVNKIFWLHVKKAGGTSMRDAFADFYQIPDHRYTYPKPFVALPKGQWNDTLNNYRIPLGEYDYKRMQFAKKFLYSEEEFEELYKIVIVRNPYDRIVSAWRYLFRGNKGFYDLEYLRMKHSFKYFLKKLPVYFGHRYKQIYHHGYIGLHCAPVWPDITDESGNLLVDKVIKLENLETEIEALNKEFDLSIDSTIQKNKSNRKDNYKKYFNSTTRSMVEELFSEDIKNLGYHY